MVRLPTGHQHGRADGPDGLLATKLYLPRLQPGFVPRPRLVDRLDEALARGLVLGLCTSRLRQDRSARRLGPAEPTTGRLALAGRRRQRPPHGSGATPPQRWTGHG